MAIHHQTARQAERHGFLLEEQGDFATAFMPSHGVRVYGVSPKDAFTQMQQYKAIADKRDPDVVFMALQRGDTKGYLRHSVTDKVTKEVMTPTEFNRAWDQLNWVEREIPQPIQDTIERSQNGVPFDGGIAHKEGITAADNPFDEGTEEGDAWDEQWDAAAEQAEPEEEKKSGSVVAEKYRAIYAERGHPTHCGDALAVLLNNLCQTAKETDLGRFEEICNANGIDLGKYNRTANGWQGRLRMTGRNLLSRKVWENNGVLNMPAGSEFPSYQMDAEWMASRKFKKA